MIPKGDARTYEEKDDADKLREIEDRLDTAIGRSERPVRCAATGVSLAVLRTIVERYASGGWCVDVAPARGPNAYDIRLT